MDADNHPWEVIYRREGRVFGELFAAFPAVVEKFRQHGCQRILDLGCGNGRHVVGLEKSGFQVIGLDISRTGLRLAQAWLEDEDQRADLAQADVRQALPFAEGSFDGLLSTQVIHHAMIVEVRRSIAEIKRVLTTGGIAFVTVSGRKDDGLAFEEVEPGTFVPLDGSEAGLPYHIFSERELARELENFHILEISHRAEGKVLAALVKKA
jgi:SAM-dependent methyltransferase